MIREDAAMRIRPLRLLAVLAALLALAAPATALAGLHGAAGDRGVVQAIDAQHIVLKTLDGTAITFGLLPGTQVRLNGAPATTADILPGFVADVVADRKGRAIVIRAYGGGGAAATIDRGTITAVTKTSLTITLERGGPALTFTIDRNTRVKLPGALARKGLLRPGALVSVTHASDGTALVITILKRAGA
jgi:hypothetical protein